MLPPAQGGCDVPHPRREKARGLDELPQSMSYSAVGCASMLMNQKFMSNKHIKQMRVLIGR